MKHLLIFTFLFVWMNSFSQTVNYADSVINYSSQYTASNWSANQSLGYPNTYPSYGDILTAWAHSTMNGQREYIELNFTNPMPIDSIWIYETYNGGSVDTIYVRNPGTGSWEIVYSGAVNLVTSAQIFKIGFPMTAFNVSDVRIAMDSPGVNGWNEIDAVAIVNSNSTNTTLCSGDSILISSTYQSTPGIYADSTLALADIQFITVDTSGTTFNVMTVAACDSYVSPSGLYVWTTSNTYMDTISNVAGCDSVITVNLTINSTNASTSLISGTINATTSGAIYLWLDCDDSFNPIPGETSQFFTPSQNGNYAVVVTDNGCADTSSCVAVIDLGDYEHKEVLIEFYPNPVQDELSISANKLIQTIVVIDLTGREVYRSEKVGKLTEKVDFNNMAHGMYYVQVEVDAGVITQTIMR